MRTRKVLAGFALAASMVTLTAPAWALTPKQLLGSMLYADTSLSNPPGQSCATCHHPSAGWADPANRRDPYSSVVSLGADGFSVGGRNAPSAAYAAFSPVFGWNDPLGMYLGGQFWDGRAPTLADQAKGPFLNPLEMANTMEGVVAAVRSAPYARLFLKVFGPNAFADVPTAYDYIAEAIADFESTRVLNRFSSRYDQYLAGTGTLTAKELLGLQIYQGKALCDACHPSKPTVAADGTVAPPLFTDYSYDNLGIPKSLSPLLAGNPIDYGLGGRLDIAGVDPVEVPDGLDGTVVVSAGQAGKFKVPTLRNIAKTPPYGHNGYFATLTAIVSFYNTAGVPGLWPDPEVGLNVNRTELGNLGLTTGDVDALVAFLRTLTDQH